MMWRKSSYSSTDGNCVEVRADLSAVRDSKNVDGPDLAVSSLGMLVHSVKTGAMWRKSSYSGDGNCVEVRADLSAVRDSKNVDGPDLAVSSLRVLVDSVKTGRLDR